MVAQSVRVALSLSSRTNLWVSGSSLGRVRNLPDHTVWLYSDDRFKVLIEHKRGTLFYFYVADLTVSSTRGVLNVLNKWALISRWHIMGLLVASTNVPCGVFCPTCH